MKRVASLLLTVLYTLALLTVCVPLTVCADSMYIRKVVSVVYDDSGSMTGEKWAYANYAMQAFCGMLNDEDQLFISYMSHSLSNQNYVPENVDLSSNGIQSSVDKIRAHSDSSSTPFDAVYAAYDKLKSVNDSNPNTQYWLVVITDGDFDEGYSKSRADKKSFLNDELHTFAGQTMPNGTQPQITFLAIGDDLVSPDEDAGAGIFTYSADDSDDIIDAMSQMADKVSGRTRLGATDIKQLDDRTIQVSSAIPLLNIVAFSQKSQAAVSKVVYSNETEIPINRSVSLFYPGYSELVGNACLASDSGKTIGAGSYHISFSQAVELEDIVVLFEPALEMRMSVELNGKSISDTNELKNAGEGDKVSIRCKIYEMDTDNEIPQSLLPPNTKYRLEISEDGKSAVSSTGTDMTIDNYALKNIDTEITASLLIDGFSPITRSVKFCPQTMTTATTEPQPVYTLTAAMGSGVRSVRLDDLSGNHGVSIVFSVSKDGVPLTDTAAVQALTPVITVAPQGNSGTTAYSQDGKIIFTPNACVGAGGEGSFDVDVTCTLADGTSATEQYTVVLADYQVLVEPSDGEIVKTEFYRNTVGAGFRITRDGTPLDRNALKSDASVQFNEPYAEYPYHLDVAPDGTITVTPYTEQEHRLTFWNWWVNWAYYFGLPGENVSVTLNHSLGSASAELRVVPPSISYRILNVYLPLLICLALLAFLVTWAILIVTKPKFSKNAMLYVGSIRYNSEHGTHMIRGFTSVRLNKFNSFKYRYKFRKKAEIVSANGLQVRAEHGNVITCEENLPWYTERITPYDGLLSLDKVTEVAEYIARHRTLEINEISTLEAINSENQKKLFPQPANRPKYIVVPADNKGVREDNGVKVIHSGQIFVYTTG